MFSGGIERDSAMKWVSSNSGNRGIDEKPFQIYKKPRTEVMKM